MKCRNCGKQLKAKDEAAGKRTKCPDCENIIEIPQPVYDAEEVPADGFAEDEADEYEEYDDYADEYDDYSDGYDDYGDDYSSHGGGRSSSSGRQRRRPCPDCGEMIVSTAVKCRFCGEVFDHRLSGSKRVRSRSYVDRDEIRKFRKEMHGVGGLWIFFGVVCGLAGIVFIGNPPRGADGTFGLVLLFLGALWGSAGVGTCAKQLWGLWMGLILCYLSLLGNLVRLPESLCPLLFIIAALVQSHRCLSTAKKLRDAGIPLTERA